LSIDARSCRHNGPGAKLTRKAALILPLILLAGTARAGLSPNDLRPLVEMTVHKAWNYPADGELVSVTVFHNGLLHFEDVTSWERSFCANTYARNLPSLHEQNR
jgi:hypothetical protein